MQKHKKVMIVPLNSPLFEQAVFFLRSDAQIDEADGLRQAEEIAAAYMDRLQSPRYFISKKRKRGKSRLPRLLLLLTVGTICIFCLLKFFR